MTMGLGESLARSIRENLHLGGDGRNLLLYSRDLSNVVWLDGSDGSTSVALGPGHRLGTNRSARTTYEIHQLVGANAEYADTTVTFSAWVRPVSGCTNLGIEVRNEAGATVDQEKHPTPTSTDWKYLSATVTFGSIADKAEIIVSNDDGAALTAVFDIQDLQFEVGTRATSYQPTTDGTTPLQTLLDVVSAEYEDGIVLNAPSVWAVGDPGEELLPSLPSGFITVDKGQLTALGVTGVGAGGAVAAYAVTIGVIETTEPSNPDALFMKLHRHVRAIYERCLDIEAAGGFDCYSMGGAPVDVDFGTALIGNGQVVADAAVTLTFARTEAR